MSIAGRALKGLFNAVGFDLVKRRRASEVQMPVELSGAERDIVHYVKRNRLTKVSDERLWATLMACKHAIDRSIDGDFVECGVWRGGNALLAAAMLKLHGVRKKVYLFDTFEGMTAPTDDDRTVHHGIPAAERFHREQRAGYNEWCYASLDDVRNNFQKADLLSDNVIFVKGDVARTLDIDANLPSTIAMLRLDTDWYESTKKELDTLYPRLTPGGVLIIDDYGHWAGAKKAADEFFAKHGNRPFLQYTDYTGRVGVKVS